MNYEDEDYVRFYTRDTVSWVALGWEGQTVLSLMLHGKFDRSGVFDCDGHNPSHAVTIVTRLPDHVVETGLRRLLDSGTWVERNGKLVWPKYVHAQTCRRSDKARQRESREKRRTEALGQPVTNRDDEPGRVTACDDPSQSVTPSRADPIRAEPSRAEIPLPPFQEPDSDKRTIIPLNFQLHQSAIDALVKAYCVSEAAIRYEVDEFRTYWTIGGGMGQKRSNWQAKCRENIRQKHESGELARTDARLKSEAKAKRAPVDAAAAEAEFDRRQRAKNAEFLASLSGEERAAAEAQAKALSDAAKGLF